MRESHAQCVRLGRSAATAPEGTEGLYTAFKFYRQIPNTFIVDFIFVIVPFLEPDLKVVMISDGTRNLYNFKIINFVVTASLTGPGDFRRAVTTYSQPYLRPSLGLINCRWGEGDEGKVW